MRVFRSLASYTPGTFEGWLHRITTNLFLDMAPRKQRIRFEGLPDRRRRACRRRPAPARPSTTAPGRRYRGRADGAAAGVPGSGRALRCRGAVLRGDRRDARHQAGHRAQPDPPRPGQAACSPGTPPPAAHLGETRVPSSARPDSQPDSHREASHEPSRPSAFRADRRRVDDAERDRVLLHLARCEPCRGEAVALRTLKRRMNALGGAAAGAALTRRLMGLGRLMTRSRTAPSPCGGRPWPRGRDRLRGIERAREFRPTGMSPSERPPRSWSASAPPPSWPEAANQPEPGSPPPWTPT